jgi:hypothetical protein
MRSLGGSLSLSSGPYSANVGALPLRAPWARGERRLPKALPRAFRSDASTIAGHA